LVPAVQVALGVLDHLRRLGHLDARRPVDAGLDHRLVERRDLPEGLFVIPRHHLEDGGQGMFLVARVDAFGREADVEIGLPLHAGMLFEDGNADFLGGAGIDGRLEHHDRSTLHVLAYRLGSAGQGREVGIVGDVDRGRHGNDDEIRFAQDRGVGTDFEMGCGLQVFSGYLPGRVDEILVMINFGGGEIEAERPAPLSEFNRQWQANISESNYCNDCFCVHFIGSDSIFANCLTFETHGNTDSRNNTPCGF
jgi:hypothetical protein